MLVQNLPVEKISIRSDARHVRPENVEALQSSIAEVGLINPIRVRALGDGWEVVAGVHRFKAVAALGLADIQALVATDDDLRAELAMIDENLCRAELSPSERAQQTARRKAIYLELHPETAHGGDRKSDQVANLATRSFDAETAAATGQSERAIRRDAERGEKVYEAAMALIKGTPLDTGVFLDKLKKLTPSEQITVCKRELAWIKQQEREGKKGIARRVVKIADEPLTDEEAAEKQYATLVSAWNKAGEQARHRFRELIDTPIMDRRFA